MKSPFPYFGSKSAVSHIVWRALGSPAHYIEPFFGSGAVLLNRPDWTQDMTETICDADGYVCNVWRSMQFAPDETARWCDWPVNHADLIARKARMIREKNYLLENLCRDEKWYDAELAGYWIWAASCWIGHGLTRPGQKIPHVSSAGMGVHKKGQIPHVSNAGKGVHAKGKRPHVSNAGMGVTDAYNTNIYLWFRKLSERLRYVRVVCGDWTRVCGGKWQAKRGTCGIFFDPPYGADADRDSELYDTESLTVADDVAAWALKRGASPDYRIVLAGYDSEHGELVEAGWRTHSWSAQGGYSNTARQKTTRGKDNRHREVLFFSPYCCDVRNEFEF